VATHAGLEGDTLVRLMPADDLGDAQAVLDAIAAGGGDRAAITRAARTTRDRDSVVGRYSIDAEGHTTLTAYGRLAVVDGALAWDVAPVASQP
jgi:hypothetical protein